MFSNVPANLRLGASLWIAVGLVASTLPAFPANGGMLELGSVVQSFSEGPEGKIVSYSESTTNIYDGHGDLTQTLLSIHSHNGNSDFRTTYFYDKRHNRLFANEESSSTPGWRAV